jgi:hypothetical protein
MYQSKQEGERLAESNPSSGKVTVFIGIASSVLTIALTVFNTYTKARIDAADEQLKQRTADLDIKIRQQTAELDQSRDRTARYAFVHTLFAELAGDPKKQELTVNLIRLSLSDEEAERLFQGFSIADDKSIQKAGSTGIALITRAKNNLDEAAEKERDGFQALIDGNYSKAASAFEASEKAYPTYHWVYELGRLLKSHQSAWNDPSAMKPILQQIVSKYAYGAPPDIFEQLRAKAK